MSSCKNNNAKRKPWKPSFEYKADYNDHFETPAIAYQDIAPLLDAIQPERKRHSLYDPYYCNGRTAVLLRQLGFDNIAHAKRDFYKDIKENNVPAHDTLITNPPYSESHKEQCIEFCVAQFLKQNRPFFLLMPNYVAARNYFRRLIQGNNCEEDVAYLVPANPYEYDHPEGTGHEIPPFQSLWFVGVGKEVIERIKESYEPSTNGARFVTSLQKLEELAVISTQRRLNPRQRRKRRANLKMNSTTISSTSTKKTVSSGDEKPAVAAKKTKKSSRYRDSGGKRTKKRF